MEFLLIECLKWHPITEALGCYGISLVRSDDHNAFIIDSYIFYRLKLVICIKAADSLVKMFQKFNRL